MQVFAGLLWELHIGCIVCSGQGTHTANLTAHLKLAENSLQWVAKQTYIGNKMKLLKWSSLDWGVCVGSLMFSNNRQKLFWDIMLFIHLWTDVWEPAGLWGDQAGKCYTPLPITSKSPILNLTYILAWYSKTQHLTRIKVIILWQLTMN